MESTIDDSCPSEWEGIATRVAATHAEDDTGFRFRGWFLLEDIEGSVGAGQIWLDGESESISPERAFMIESEHFDAAMDERIAAILANY